MMDRMNMPGNEDINKLFGYLRYNSYRSSRYKLFYVATPKVACTSLKWWFAGLEGYTQDIRGITDSMESDPDLAIHDTFHRVAPDVTGLMPEALSEVLSSDSYFRFAVISNPYKRIFSAWQSKLLLKEPLQIGPYLNCNFFNCPIECKEDLAKAFESFLEHLASNESLDFWDFHWTPQANLLRPDLVRYSKLVKIENKEELSKALADRLGSTIPDPFKGPRLNESLIPYCQEFLTERSIELIRSLFSVDFETFGYDTQPHGSGQVFTDDQFDLVRKSIMLIRGRHQRLDERHGQILTLNQQLTQQELTIQDKEASIINKNEKLRGKSEELRVRSEELKVRSEELQQRNKELEQKIKELGQKSEEIRNWKTELRQRTSELNWKTEELDQTTEELNQKTEKLHLTTQDLNQANEDLHRKIIELSQKSLDINQKNDEISQKKTELNQKTSELNQKTSELNQKTSELNQTTTILNQKEAELNQKVTELNQRTEQLNLVLTSRTWILTKPVRMVLDIPVSILGKASHNLSVIASIIKLNGGIKNALGKTIRILMKEGIVRVPFHYKMQSSHAGKAAESASPPSPLSFKRGGEVGEVVGGSPRVHTEIKQFQSLASILFIGHDARLAGAQVLLLSLIKWFSGHTGIGIKIILLQGGVLLDKFRDIAPTLIWEELLHKHPENEDRHNKLAAFAGKVDLIYGNTVLSPGIFDDLAFLNAPFITHVHELEESIKLYVGKSAIEKMRTYTGGYVACSDPVSFNLNVNHGIEKEKIVTIHEFIEDRQLSFFTSKNEFRKTLGLNGSGIIVIGCGTFYWRKGGDLFIETALRLKQKGLSDFHFYWIGENIWDNDSVTFKLSSWNRLEKRIKENKLSNHITFLRVRDNVFDYLQAGDVFYLPSREDPFPLVCLEAAQCSIPVICFEDAGGMPGFVENDAGFVVPFEDIDAAAEKIVFLHQNPSVLTGLGVAARKKFLQRHSIEKGAPAILDFCRKVGNFQPAVSIIVPNYNCEKFLGNRMESIFSQTFRDFEVIILDDASADRSLEIIEKYLHFPNVRLIKNQINSGSPFIQWQKGLAEAKGEIIWFAEADDFCEPDFLNNILPYFNNPSLALAYCDSAIIDENDIVTGDYSNYYRSLDPDHWKSSYQVTGTREINYGLGVKNSIPNASAVLLRKSFIPANFYNDSSPYRFSGDWIFYTRVIKGKQVAFHSEKLNYHRKHRQTVTSDYNTGKGDLLLKEAGLIHSNIMENYSIDADFLPKWEYYITEQIHAFFPDACKEEFDTYYPFTLIERKIKDAIIKSKNSKRLVFITTNDGSSDGGSEQLWKKAAIECSRRGHKVMVVIKKWDPEPFFLKDFYTAGITVLFKEQDHFHQMKNFDPDLLIISLGDQDEGVEYYEQFRECGIPYVIVNQLTKEPKYWPVNPMINERVRKGYLGSQIALFTGKNNRELMEKRLGCKISRAGIIYNPFDVGRNTDIPFPSMEKGLKIAVVGNMLRIHKGQHLAIELFHLKKWKERPLHLNIYGEGVDEEVLKKQAADYKMNNVTFHGHTNNILSVWKENHAILMPSFMEGLPLALVGAMICGRVPVVTDIGAHSEVIDDNISGFIAAEPTMEALDEALERAFKRSADWEEIGQNARDAILQILPQDPVDHFIGQLNPFIEL
jgi:glycosyltransferase involved in cell wall biosynthesis/uncharacterized coiled-coil DUF342 family protein